jgi:hypothetical protein
MLEAAPARCTAAAKPVTARQLTTPTTTAFLPARGVTSFGALGSRTTSRSTARLSVSLGAIPVARGEARGNHPACCRASPHGRFLGVDGRHCRRPSALRSGRRALRSCCTSPAGDAIWARRRDVNPMPAVGGAMVAWLSRHRARRRKASAQVCPRGNSEQTSKPQKPALAQSSPQSHQRSPAEAMRSRRVGEAQGADTARRSVASTTR